MIIPNFYKRAITGRLEVKLCQEQLEISDLGRICFIEYLVMRQESPVTSHSDILDTGRS